MYEVVLSSYVFSCVDNMFHPVITRCLDMFYTKWPIVLLSSMYWLFALPYLAHKSVQVCVFMVP